MIYELREPVTAVFHRDYHEGWRSPAGIYLCHSGIRRMFRDVTLYASTIRVTVSDRPPGRAIVVKDGRARGHLLHSSVRKLLPDGTWWLSVEVES
jgi:hypothetical protein